MTPAALLSALAAVAISLEMTLTAAVLGAAALLIAGYGG
ncbi:hypothetical protein V1282_002903 [Nitrobacteraceae bacterium AZCC 2146]